MKILFLCNKSPFPAREGGPMAMEMMIGGLIRAGHQVKVLAINSEKYNIRPEEIPEDYRKTTGIELIDVDLRVKATDAFLNLFTGKSYHVQRFISDDFRQALRRTLKRERFDVVQFEMLYMSPYLEEVRTHSDASAVLRTHNIEHRIWQRVAQNEPNPLKRIYLHYLVHTLKNYEGTVVKNFDGIVAITRQDAVWFEQILQGANPKNPPVTAIPFGIDPAAYFFKPDTEDFPSLFSLGSMDWIPNAEGIRWFLEKVWPEVHRKFPTLKYFVAGRNMPSWITRMRCPNVEVVGEVADAKQFMASKAILLVPLFAGSGIRIKIIEGMATGKAVISTTIGAEGIEYTNGSNILIADDKDSFMKQIAKAVADRAGCTEIGRQARRLIETRYHRDLLIGELAGFYQKIRH